MTHSEKRRLFGAGLLAALWVAAGPAAGVELEVADELALPASAAAPPLARVNQLREPPDGSGRLFAGDLRGPLHVIDGAGVALYLDLAVEFPHFRDAPGLATGFVSFAFHPEFASNGLFYTVHTEDANGAPNLGPALPIAIAQHAVLSEFDATDPAANAFAGTRRELMRIASPHRFHNLGEIAFDPTAAPSDPDYGLLYIGAGDFGSVAAGDPDQLQRLDTVFGAVLRIDPLGGPFLRGGTSYDYGIPAGNPWVDGDPDTFDEIWAHGFRNCHRLVWDPAGNGSLFCTDIGEDNFEELNLVVAGENYGWPLREGNMALDPYTDPGTVFALPPNDASFGFRYPVALVAHPEADAVAGGFIERGGMLPGLEGRLLFGDIVSGRIWSAAVADLEAADDGDPATVATVVEEGVSLGGTPTTLLQIVRDELGDPSVSRTDLRLHRDLAGALLLTTKRDGMLRLPEPEGLPAALALLWLLRRSRRRRRP